MQTPKPLLLPIISILCFQMMGQKSVIKKANKEFDTYDYIDARKIYLKVVENGYESAQIYKKLGDTYYFNSDYPEALKWYTKLHQIYPNDMEPIYYHRMAQSLKSSGDYLTSKKLMGAYAGLSASSRLAEIFVEKYPSLDSLAQHRSTAYEIVNITKSMKSSDFGPSFYLDKLVYASSSQNTEGNKVHNWSGLPYLDLYQAELDANGAFTKTKPLEGEINSPYHESTAAFTKDGETVYFTRNNYINGKKGSNKQKLVSLKIYRASKKKDESWGSVKELPFNSDSYSVAHPALSPDEKRLYFSSDMQGTLGLSDIWYVDILDNFSFGPPVNLGAKINTEARETFPFISENNNLYFSSDGHMGLGGLDVFKISLEDTVQLSEVINLKPPINTAMDDFGFIIKEEEQIGFLSSNRDGKPGSMSDDIYRIKQSCGKITVKGNVENASSKEPIREATITLLDDKNQIITKTKTNTQGEYTIENGLECEKQHTIRVEPQGLNYDISEKIFTTPLGSGALDVDFQLTSPDCALNDLGCRLKLQPIYFDYGKDTIRKDAEVELAKILHALKEYPSLRIHIESHTDSRSGSKFNMKLSEKRAASTRLWLINNGTEAGRLTAKGYGETQLLNNCINGVRCPESDHQLNRRSVFTIISD
ncbi:MAG: OmpA family protein [Bacteroidota bacterium]